MAGVADFEPLLTDSRVGKIADLLMIQFPELPRDVEVFTFIVPEQTTWDGKTVPEQAVFAMKSPNPRASFDQFYRGKEVMTTSGMWMKVWRSAEAERKHFVTTREDPAYGPLAIAARRHIEDRRNYLELI